MNFAYIIQLLDSFVALAPIGSELWNRLTADRSKFADWAATNYVPTQADYDALHAERAPYLAIIAARAAQG